MKFKVDENLPLSVAEALRQAGHDALTVREQGHVGAQDGVLARVCRDEGRALVTQDLDFGDIRAFPPEDYAGIIVLRSDEPSKPAAMELLEVLLSELGKDSPVGALWVISEGRVRIRRGRREDH